MNLVNSRPVRLLKPILLRLAVGLLSLVFISFVTFVADELTPGDAATVIAGDKASPETVARIRHNMGLDRPWPERYGKFLVHAAEGDFGNSYADTREPVKDILKRTVPITLKIALYSITLASAIGILLGTLASIYRGKFADRVILTLSTLGVTVPNFVLAPILVYIFALKLDQLPLRWEALSDQRAPEFYYLILPIVILAARPAALITRLTRAQMIDTLQQEFIRTAIAKGVPKGRLIFRHALRNAILPVITTIGTSFGFLLTGSFVVERAYTITGLGSTTIEAVSKGNMPVIQACVLITGAMFIFLNLIVDILLPILDPRIRESQI